MGGEFKKNVHWLKETNNFFKSKKVQAALLIILLLAIIVVSSQMRLQNTNLLEDTTTGEKIPLALDPFYFLRVAETKVANGGVLPELDNLRYPSGKAGFTKEILPTAVIAIWKVGKVFDAELTLRHANILSPVIFFILGLIAFFMFIYSLTGSRWTALGSSAILAFVPSYLHRTIAGFSDHEAIGMFAFLTTLLAFTLGLKYLNKIKSKTKSKKSLIKVTSFGAGVGLLSSLTIASWGGIANFLFMIIPLSFLVLWATKFRDSGETNLETPKKYIAFYFSWILFSVLGTLIFGFDLGDVISKYLSSGQTALGPFVLLFMLVDFFAIHLIKKDKEKLIKKINFIKRYRVLTSLISSLVLSVLVLVLMGSNIGSTIKSIYDSLIRPAGTSRVGVTVSENRAPFLNDWISQVGKMFFWIFIAGVLFIGKNISKKIRNKKYRAGFFFVWLILIAGIIFSRISSGSVLNGTNFLSQLIYFGSILIFTLFVAKIYSKTKINLSAELAVLFSWALLMIISARGTIRIFFIIVPFMSFMGIYALQNSIKHVKKSKDELTKIFFIIVALLFSALIILSLVGYVQAIDNQSERAGPSANVQWQQAMEWVRENTSQNAIFLHWWDYGYWVQYLGERATIADGGHIEGSYQDHLIGRHVLTTPNPDSALSYMKTQNVSHLLIDPTDLGKYQAYSSIGSDQEGQDRRSQIPPMGLVSSQKDEQNKTTKIYQGGSYVDRDIIYSENGKEIFLPEGKAIIAGVSVGITETHLGAQIEQPRGIFIYNENQIVLPLKNVFYRNELRSFPDGVDATVMIIPSVSNDQGSASIDHLGGLIYLSPKVSESLFAQLYLLGDPNNLYPTIKLSHSQQDPFVKSLKSQGALSGDYLLYRGFRGPIKIWDVDYPENVIVKEEFLERVVPEEGYGSIDNISFTR